MLKTFLHAAALGGKTVVDVQRWCRGDYSGAEAILTGQADPLVDPAGQLTQHTVGAEETTSGVMRYVENTLACFSHRSVIDLCTPSPDDEFDMRAFVEAKGTVYLLGKGERLSSASALTTAFAEELMFVAGDVMAPARPGRRLTPPLLACLDEAPSVAPIPSLALHLADARGRGIVIVVSAQSPSQLRTEWSAAEAETMFNASTVKIIFGGLSVDSDLDWLSKLTGRRYVLSHTRQTRPRLADRLLIALGRSAGAAGRRDPHPQPRARLAHVLRHRPGHHRPALDLRHPRRPSSPRRHAHHGLPQRPGPSLNRRGVTEPSDYQAWASPSWSAPARRLPTAGTPDDPDFDVGGTWPWDWSAMSRQQAQRMWDRLQGFVAYLNHRYAWDYPQQIPMCWAFHGGLVEELTTLYWSRWAAFSGPDASPDKAQAWHSYCLPPFYGRLAAWCGGPQHLSKCQAGGHEPARQHEGRAGQADRWAKLTDNCARMTRTSVWPKRLVGPRPANRPPTRLWPSYRNLRTRRPPITTGQRPGLRSREKTGHSNPSGAGAAVRSCFVNSALPL